MVSYVRIETNCLKIKYYFTTIMFLSRRLRCTFKYASVDNYHLNTSRFLKNLVNKEQCSHKSRSTCFNYHQISHISTLPLLAREHTTKGWKYKARDGVIPDELPHDACEEGKEAVPHAVLVSELQKCPTVASQIEKFCSLLSITSEEVERRKAFCQSLEEVLSMYFKNFRVTQFGSSVNGLGFKGCDADVCFHTFNNEDYVTLKEVPSLQSVLDGTISQKTLQRMTPKYTLHFISRILRQYCSDVIKNIFHINARCPILRFYNVKYDVFCDFSCESQNSVRNTMLLRLLCNLDERFTIIAKIVRYWGKYGGFVGDIDTFNSYSFSLLVVHFLQTRNPPVLPAIQDVIKRSEYLQNGNVADYDLLLNDLKAFPPSQNTQTAEELLKEFFFYFLTFDFSRVMLLSTSSSIPKETFTPDKKDEVFEFGAVNMQDPFRPSFNVSSGASYKSCKKFMYSLLKTCEAYQNDSLWRPTTENWGLCSLFHQPIISYFVLNEWKTKRSHSIQLPSIPDGPKKLKNLLQNGLLFHCTEFLADDSEKEPGSKTHFKLHCKAYYKTWHGRAFVQSAQVTDNILEREHFISKEIMSQSESKRQILCEFHCELVEVVSNGKSSLVLNLNFLESKFPPIVAIFLKKFIPDIFRKL